MGGLKYTKIWNLYDHIKYREKFSLQFGIGVSLNKSDNVKRKGISTQVSRDQQCHLQNMVYICEISAKEKGFLHLR